MGCDFFPCYLEKVHPFCERNPVAVWPGRMARGESVAADQFGSHIWFSARSQFTKRMLISRR